MTAVEKIPSFGVLTGWGNQKDELMLNVEANPKSFFFLSSPIASKHSAFSLTKVPATRKKFILKEATSEAAIL